ncbi:MAG TPA: multicopper oxidase domain-containing protein [Silvibacterium sp.]|nr:multicopper oxidase domain-containing protein [Silvibacterium sp.]
MLDRRESDVFHFQDKSDFRYLGPPCPPDPVEAGWKDTVRAESGEVIWIIMKFDRYAGRYVWHCNILEHEENEMMRPYEVLVNGNT